MNNNNNINVAPAAAAAAAIAPADQHINPAGISNSNSGSASIESRAPKSIRTNNLNFQFRNDIYDRVNNSLAYDVPRSVRSSLGMRRNNLQLDLHAANRLRCGNNGKNLSVNMIRDNTNAMCRQRSFDDTESHHYYNLNYGSNSTMRYENIYEQIHDEPLYRNSTINGSSTGSRLYGRLNVIGHGIGRIERHLSSSCGNIDHYNLGGHYAVLGHSHFGTVGHIRLNTTGNGINSNNFMTNQAINSNGNSQKDNCVKTSTSSFFSCLGGENSQSMNNIYRATSANNSNCTSTTNSYLSSLNSSRINTPNLSNGGNASRNTGAIPKTKLGKASNVNSNNVSVSSAQNTLKSSIKGTTQSAQNSIQNPEHSSTLNRISKSSLQWLLVNKWLPLWMGQGPDCKVIDFNFMFSRNCDGCEYNTAQKNLINANTIQHQDIIKYNGRQSESLLGNSTSSRRVCPLNPIRPLPNNLSRLRESEYGISSTRRNGCSAEENNYENVHVHFQNGFEFGKSRENYDYVKPPMLRARSESPTFTQRVCGKHAHIKYSDPFKNYELNAENNTFKPQKREIQINKIDKFKVNEGASTSNGLSSVTKNKESIIHNNEGIVGNAVGINNFDGKAINSNDNGKKNDNDFIETKLYKNENYDDKSTKTNIKEADADTVTGSTVSAEFTYNEDFDEDSDTYEDFDSLKDGIMKAVVCSDNEKKSQNELDNMTESMPIKEETDNNDKIDENL